MNRLIGSHLARLPRLAASQQQLISARYATEYVYNKIVYVCVCVIAHLYMYACMGVNVYKHSGSACVYASVDVGVSACVCCFL